MYRVAVVDDEMLIVQGLVRTMPWEKYQCEVVATASDGASALEMIHREKPDILFTDIQMPGKDGLSVIAAVRSEYPDMQISILSGYPNFEYAQRAISLGVVRYILKPSRFAELEEALAQMVKNLEDVRIVPSGDEKQEDIVVSPENTQPELAQSTQDEEPNVNVAVENAQNFIVHNAQKYIREHYAEKLTLSDVADQVYVSQWHLSKLISRYTKQSFFDLLNGARIEKAKELLTDPALRVWEISEMVGFAEVTHFSRVFKKIVGMSANEYRSQNLCQATQQL